MAITVQALLGQFVAMTSVHLESLTRQQLLVSYCLNVTLKCLNKIFLCKYLNNGMEFMTCYAIPDFKDTTYNVY